MKKFVKVIVLAAVMVLALFSLLADMAFVRKLEQGLNLAVYIRLASVLSLLAAVFYAWGYKRRIELSQKYQRASEVLEKAESSARRRQAEMDQAEARMRNDIAAKAAALDEQIGHSVAAYQQRLKQMKEQNMELRETVNKLMRALKAERAKKRG